MIIAAWVQKHLTVTFNSDICLWLQFLIGQILVLHSLILRVSLHTNEKSKERGELQKLCGAWERGYVVHYTKVRL